MDDQLNFSWTMMFLVSGFSSFLFSFLTKILEGSHSRLLLVIGIVAMGAGICSWILKSLIQLTANYKKKKTITS
jgi:hypothetical protein